MCSALTCWTCLHGTFLSAGHHDRLHSEPPPARQPVNQLLPIKLARPKWCPRDKSWQMLTNHIRVSPDTEDPHPHQVALQEAFRPRLPTCLHSTDPYEHTLLPKTPQADASRDAKTLIEHKFFAGESPALAPFLQERSCCYSATQQDLLQCRRISQVILLPLSSLCVGRSKMVQRPSLSPAPKSCWSSPRPNRKKALAPKFWSLAWSFRALVHEAWAHRKHLRHLGGVWVRQWGKKIE